MRKNLSNGRHREGQGWGGRPGGERQALLWTIHVHGEDGSHGIHRSDEDADLTDPHGEQQPPGGLTVGLALTEDLGQPEADGDSADEGQTQQLPWPTSRTPWWLAAEALFPLISSLLTLYYIVITSSFERFSQNRPNKTSLIDSMS